MNNALFVTTELAIAMPTSTVLSASINANALLTALISLAVSIVTLVGGELVKFLVAFFQKKTKDLKGETEDTKPEDKPEE